MPNNNNNTLHIQSLLTVVPPINDVCFTGAGACAGVGAVGTAGARRAVSGK